MASSKLPVITHISLLIVSGLRANNYVFLKIETDISCTDFCLIFGNIMYIPLDEVL